MGQVCTSKQLSGNAATTSLQTTPQSRWLVGKRQGPALGSEELSSEQRAGRLRDVPELAVCWAGAQVGDVTHKFPGSEEGEMAVPAPRAQQGESKTPSEKAPGDEGVRGLRALPWALTLINRVIVKEPGQGDTASGS